MSFWLNPKGLKIKICQSSYHTGLDAGPLLFLYPPCRLAQTALILFGISLANLQGNLSI
jgi:hypothetical protein